MDGRLLEQLEAALERERRRGFCAGYDQGVDDLWLLVNDEGADLGTAYNTALEFSEDLLAAWAETNSFLQIPAPKLLE